MIFVGGWLLVVDVVGGGGGSGGDDDDVAVQAVPSPGGRIRERTGKALDLVGAGVLKVLWSYGRDLSRLVVGGFGTGWGRSDLWLSGEKGF